MIAFTISTLEDLIQYDSNYIDELLNRLIPDGNFPVGMERKHQDTCLIYIAAFLRLLREDKKLPNKKRELLKKIYDDILKHCFNT